MAVEPRPREAGRIEGAVLGRLYGWAFDLARLKPIAVRIEIDGEPVAWITPRRLRAELSEAPGAPRRCGFAWGIPPRWCDGRLHDFRLVAATDGAVLHERLGFRATAPADEIFRAWKRQALARGWWALRGWAVVNGELMGQGVAVPPFGIDRPIGLTVNGVAAAVHRREGPDYPVTDPMGLAGRFEAPRFGFRLPIAALADDATEWRLSLGRRDGPAFCPDHDIVVEPNPPVLPPEPLRARVHGGGNPQGFEIVAATAAHALRRALDAGFPGLLDGTPTVLDWGCGCGRIGRYWRRWVGGRLVGADADAEAIGWCQENLPGADWLAIRPEPPMPLTAGSVDVAIAVSVFTHLEPGAERRWLRELARVVRPGGALLATIFADPAWFLHPRPPADFLRWQREERFDFGPSPEMAGVLAGYRGVSHTHGWLHRHWTEFFEVLDIVAGGIGGYQDIAVLRRR